ncbi:MAG: Spy/CpxP family protein refolding chaperone [Bacteroidia bacterium]|nr:Spy/CpxP family protein refolding chaperone [Bacteroidia bacterium]
MKAKILGIVLLMSMSVVLMAQPTENGNKKPFRGQEKSLLIQDRQKGHGEGLNLTDAQKEAFKQGMMAVQKQIQPLRNELGEAEAHQKTLVTAEKPDIAAINKNIEKIGAIKIEMAKIQTKHHLDMRAQLTDEQKLKFDLLAEKMKDGKGPKGMKHGRGMQMNHSMN